MKKILIGLGILFIIIISIIQGKQIIKEGPIKPDKRVLLLSRDGRLITPPLSRQAPTGTDMNKCSNCKEHRDK